MRVFKGVGVVAVVAYLWLDVSGIRLIGGSTERIGVINHGHISLGSRGSHGDSSASRGHRLRAMRMATTAPLCLKPRIKSKLLGVAGKMDETTSKKGAFAPEKSIFLSTAEKARTVIQVARAGALCTFTADKDERIQGYPFGSHVDYMLDDMGWPVLLLDNSSQHTMNIMINPRASLACCTPCLDRKRSAASTSRVTLVGSVIPVEDEGEIVKLKTCFQMAHSHALKNIESPMFRFMKLKPLKMYYISGFDVVRKWLSVEQYENAQPDVIANEATEIVWKVNASKRKELSLVCKHLVGCNYTEVVMTNVDRLGTDFSVRTGDTTEEFRIGFSIEILGAEDAKSEIAKLFQDAWEIEQGYGCYEKPIVEQHSKVVAASRGDQLEKQNCLFS